MQVCQHSPPHSDKMKRTVSKLLARMKFVNCNIFLFICSLHLLHGQNFLIFFHWEVVDVSICSSLKSLEQFLLNFLHLHRDFSHDQHPKSTSFHNSLQQRQLYFLNLTQNIFIVKHLHNFLSFKKTITGKRKNQESPSQEELLFQLLLPDKAFFVLA